jgi:hypothetical protein
MEDDGDYEMEFGIGELQTVMSAINWSATRAAEFAEHVGVSSDLEERFHAAVATVGNELGAMIDSCCAIFAAAKNDDLTEIPIS